MPAPRQQEPLFDPNGIAYGDPVLSTATVGTTLTMPISSKPSGPGIVYSPEYKAQKLANATSLLSNVAVPSFLAMQKPVRYAPDGNYAVQPGGPNSFYNPITMTEPEKKPNYILWAAIALGGFFIVRRFLK
jgi:hypothetical protein